MKKQTAVDWFYTKLITGKFTGEDTIEFLYETTKAMEKEQIEDAWNKRCSHGVVSQTWHIETKNGEQYYNEKYGGDK
jgi:hypothetical protein